MSASKKLFVAGLGTTLAAVGAVQGVALADPVVAPEVTSAALTETSSVQVASSVVESDAVLGTFSFTQAQASSNQWIAKHIAEGSKYLCNSEAVLSDEAPAAEDWVLTVEGDVANPLSATIGEYCDTAAVQSVLMGCSCAGNSADGLSVANALVKGIPMLSLLELAQPEEGANTVVFVSADGYEMALPLSYLYTHYCPIVFNVNGSALVESVGGTNQLWLGSTPASYFVRDVTTIRIETRDEVPASPTSEEARASYENLPNIGVMFGGDVS